MDADPTKLSASAEALIADRNNLLYLSVTSLWEMQIKAMLGKLQLRLPLSQIVGENQQQNGLVVLPVTDTHVYARDQLPPIHNDPFQSRDWSFNDSCLPRKYGKFASSMDTAFATEFTHLWSPCGCSLAKRSRRIIPAATPFTD